VLQMFPYYRSIIQDTIHVRITNLLITDKLRELRQVPPPRLLSCSLPDGGP
jgi:hypothetical protein